MMWYSIPFDGRRKIQKKAEKWIEQSERRVYNKYKNIQEGYETGANVYIWTKNVRRKTV